MSSMQRVRDKLQKLRDDILQRKLQKVSGKSTQKIKNSKKKTNYYINSINSVPTKVPRAIAKNNIGRVKTKRRTRHVTFKKNFNFSNSPIKGSPLYKP